MEQYNKYIRQMEQAGRRAYGIKLQSGDGGNLSIRIKNEELILIKASGCSMGELNEDNIVLVDFEGNVIAGKKKPSREILTHIAIYKSRVDVEAIFHSHSPWTVSMAQFFDVLPGILLPLEMKIGVVPIIDAKDNHSNDQVAQLAAKTITEDPTCKCFIQRRHGLFCMSSSIIKAEHDAELIEDASQIALLDEQVRRKR